MKESTNTKTKGLGKTIKDYINGSDAKLESNIIDVEASKENYIKNHQGEKRPKFRFFDYTMNTYLILFTVVTVLTLLFGYLITR